jgi:hypothetical protein
MAQGFIKQNSFITGLISRPAWERADIQQYAHGMYVADNVVVRSQGGVSRRSGTRYVDRVPSVPVRIDSGFTISAPNGGDVGKLTNGDLFDYFKTTTAIGTTNPYVGFSVGFTTATPVDYFDVLMVSIDNGQNRAVLGYGDWFLQYSDDLGVTWKDARSIWVSNINDDSYRVYVGVPVTNIRLARVGVESLAGYYLWVGGIAMWSVDGIQGQGVARLEAMVKGFDQNYLLMFSNYSLDVYRMGKLVNQLPTPQIAPAQIPFLKFSSIADSLIVTHPDIEPLVVQLFREDYLWRIFPMIFSKIPRYDSNLSKETLGGNCAVSEDNGKYILTSDTNNFNASDVGCMVFGNGGSCRIVYYESQKRCQVVVVNSFPFGWGFTMGSNWTIERNSEPLWGETQGYPECSCFFANRLWLGGFRRAKNVIACSVIGDYFNFDQGDSSDDDALVVALQSGTESHHVRFLYGQDNLEIFSETGIFALRKFDSGSLVNLVSSFYFRKSLGIDPYIRPFAMEDSGTMLIKHGRNELREMTYNNESYSYDSQSRTIFCPEAIMGASSVCMVRPSEKEVANRVFIVNGEGNLVCITFLISDNVCASTIWKTDGKFVTLGATLEDAYAIVRRNGVLFLEQFHEEAFLDCEATFENFSGGALLLPARFWGRDVQVRADDEFLGEFSVSLDGLIHLPDGNWKLVHVGFPFVSDVVPVPPEMEGGKLFGKWQNFYQAVFSCYDTQGFTVDGYNVEFLGRTFNGPNLTPREEKDGRYRVFLGGDPKLLPLLRIRQPFPLTFTIRSISYGLEAN